MKEIVLGREERAQCREVLREGVLTFCSRNGLAPASRLLIEALPKRLSGRILTALDPGGCIALAAAALFPGARISHFEMDVHVAEQVRKNVGRNDSLPVEVVSGADLPGVFWDRSGDEKRARGGFEGEPFSAILITLSRSGDSLLAREMLEEAHLALEEGGSLVAATDQPGGAWLRRAIKEVAGNCEILRHEGKQGCAFLARRSHKKARLRDRSHSFPMHAAEQTVWLRSRPGVFSHGHLDQGTKALLEGIPFPERARPQDLQVLDLGCGYGALGLYAAVAWKASGATLVDSSCRAVDLARLNAQANAIENATVVLAPTLDGLESEQFDLVLANPPYFSNFRIADEFVKTARRTLAPGGMLALVAKEREQHAALIEREFGRVVVKEHQGYGIFLARKPRSGRAQESG
ncbi:MAG: methyltransferase [Planctomycetota bacterium]